METSSIAQWALVMIAGLQTVYYYTKLPPKVASHFDASGAPNGWSPTGSLFLTYWAVIAIALLLSLGIPALLGKLPRQSINLPNRDYWLSDEKFPETQRFFTSHFRWFGVLMLLLLVILFQMIFQANLSERPGLGPAATWLLVGFLAAIAVWGTMFVVRFSKTP